MPVDVKLEPPISFIQRQAGAFRQDLENLVPLWDKFDDTLHEITEEQFSSHGHGAWPGLAESTIAQKSAHGFPLDPLIRTGSLKDSFDPLSKGPQSFIWGSEVEYAGYHQDGTPRMPQRKVIDIRVEDRRRLEQDQVRYVNESAARTFGRI
jgi:phage gpG-like protein